MSRPASPFAGLDSLREALAAYHVDPTRRMLAAEAVGEPPFPRTRSARSGGGSGTVVPLRAAPDPAEEPYESTPEAAEVVALVARAQAGDAEAFGALYDRYLDLVYRYVYYRVGSAALAEDLVSETFLRALRRIGSFQWQGRDFAAWLVTIARNIMADHFKSSRFRLEVSTADMLDADRATDGIEGEVLEGLTNAALLEAVKQLNSEQQECVVLRFLQGMSVLETAQAMDKSEGAIKALQYRAVRTLGRMLPQELVQ